jgi:hypothetical protein
MIKNRRRERPTYFMGEKNEDNKGKDYFINAEDRQRIFGVCLYQIKQDQPTLNTSTGFKKGKIIKLQ